MEWMSICKIMQCNTMQHDILHLEILENDTWLTKMICSSRVMVAQVKKNIYNYPKTTGQATHILCNHYVVRMFVGSCGKANYNGKIIGGSETKPNQYPWQVSI